MSIRQRTVLTLVATGLAGAVLGAWLVLALQLAGSGRGGQRELRAPDAASESPATAEAPHPRSAALAGDRRRLLGAALAVSAALLLAAGLARQLVGRLAAGAAADVGTGPPSASRSRAGFASSPELMQVGASFGRLVDDLQGRYREVARHRDQLEVELLACTRELALAQEEANERAAAARPRRIESGVEPAPPVPPHHA